MTKKAIAFAALALASAACVLTDTSREHEQKAKASATRLAAHADVSGLGADDIVPAALVYDDASMKMLYVGIESGRPAMRRCNHDGTGCTAHFLDGGRRSNSGAMTAVLDPIGKKLVVGAVEGEPGSERVVLYRCGLDGAACSHVDITSSLPAGLSSPVVDETREKLYIAGCAAGRAAVRQCNLDGTSCSGITLDGPCASASAALDRPNDKLLVVTNAPERGPTVLHRCARDLSECTSNQIADISHASVALAVDEENGRFFVTDEVAGQSGDPVMLTRCNVDGRECTRRALASSGLAAPHIIRGELVIRASAGPSATLFRCTLDGETCTSKRIGFEDGGDYPSSAQVVYDATHDMFLLPTKATGSDTPTVFVIAPVVMRQPRDGSAHQVHDVSAGPGEMPYFGIGGRFGASIFDEATRKLYVLGENDIRGLSDERRFHRVLSRCNPDGTQCTFADAQNMRKLLGVVDGMLVSLGFYPDFPIVAGTPEHRPLEILRCGVDGRDCRRTEVFGGFGDGLPHGAVLDAQGRRALVVTFAPFTETGPEDRRAHLYACPVHSDACAAPVALPMPIDFVQAIAFDAHQRKLLVLHHTSDGERLARCAPDGTSCSTTSVPLTAHHTGARVLAREDALTILALASPGDFTSGDVTVVRCAPDGTACTTNDVPFAANTLHWFDATHDATTGDLLVVVDADARGRRGTLLRCNADGSACAEHDMSAGQPANTGEWPTALFDATTRTALAVTANAATDRASLFTLTLDGVPSPTDGGGSPATDGGSGPGIPPDAGEPRDAGTPKPPTGRDGGGGKTW